MMKTTARYLKRQENIERVKAKVCMAGGGGFSNRCEMGGRVRKKGWDVHSNTWDTTPMRQPTKVTLEIKQQHKYEHKRVLRRITSREYKNEGREGREHQSTQAKIPRA
jgi:hypothetical protein